MVDLVQGTGALWAASLVGLALDVRDLLVVQTSGGPQLLVLTGAAGASGGGLIRLGADGSVLQTLPHSSGLSTALSEDLQLLTDGSGQGYLVVGVDGAGRPVAYDWAADGQIGDLTTLPVSGGSLMPNSVVMTSVENGDVLYAVMADGGLGRLGAEGAGYTLRSVTYDDGGRYLADPVALEVVTLGGQDFLLAYSGQERGVTAFRVEAGTGTLVQSDVLGAFQGVGLLPVAQTMEAVTLNDRQFVLLGSASAEGQAGALTVLELMAGDSLIQRDHILDNQVTRFGGLQDLTLMQHGGRTYVAAAGADDGVSLFELLQDGRLLHLASHSGVMNPTALAGFVDGNEMTLLLAPEAAAGLQPVTADLSAENPAQFSVAGALSAGGGNDLLQGGSGNNDLSGGWGHDILIDGAGTDRLTGGGGGDRFVLEHDNSRDTITDFRSGQDRLDLGLIPMLYSAAQLGIESTAWGARLTIRGDVTDIYSHNGSSLSAAQVMAGLTWAADRPLMVPSTELRGTEAADALNGTAQAEVISGLGGADTLQGGAGADTIYGGDGADQIVAGDGADEVWGGLGADQLWLGTGADVFHDEAEGAGDWVSGEAGNDSLYAAGGNDTLLGGDGADLLLGGLGDDSLTGGAGADVLEGDAGEDWFYGNAGNDTLRGGDGIDRMWGHDGGDRFFGDAGDDRIYAGDGFDHIYGGSGNDLIYGGDKADQVWAGSGDDTVYGGKGADNVLLGDGNDIFYDRGQGGTAGQDRVQAGAGNDTLLGQGGADLLEGQKGYDWIEGGIGWDTLRGGNGFDTLIGGNGNDLLEGGELADVFVFQQGSGADTISDFGLGNDRLQLDVGRSSLAQLSPVEEAAGLRLNWDGGSVLLQGISLADLDAGDLVFL